MTSCNKVLTICLFLPLFNLLVNPSASCLSEGVYMTSTISESCSYLVNLSLMSTCLVLPLKPRVVAAVIAAWLSQNQVILPCLSLNSFNIPLRKLPCPIPFAKAVHSDSVVLSMMLFSVLDDHVTGEFPSSITYPIQLLRVSGSPAKSASEYPFNCRSIPLAFSSEVYSVVRIGGKVLQEVLDAFPVPHAWFLHIAP